MCRLEILSKEIIFLKCKDNEVDFDKKKVSANIIKHLPMARFFFFTFPVSSEISFGTGYIQLQSDASHIYDVRWEKRRNTEKENKRSVKITKRNNSKKQTLYLLSALSLFPFSLSLPILMSTTVVHPTAAHRPYVTTRRGWEGDGTRKTQLSNND